LHSFAVPLLCCSDVVFMKLEVSHRFMSESVVGVVAETGFKESLSLLHAPRVDKYVRAYGVGFGLRDGSELKRSGIDGEDRGESNHFELALIDVIDQGLLELIEVPEDMLRGGDGVFLLSEEFDVVRHVVGVLLTVGYFDVMSECPRFGVENGSLFLLVVVGRRVVDFEKSGERQEVILAEILTEIEDVVLADLAEKDLFLSWMSVF
jgi:hypothetical protein